MVSALFVLACLVTVIVVANRAWNPDFTQQSQTPGSAPPTAASTQITVMTWNLGFAGLGQKAEFFADGGRYIRPLSKRAIEAAASRIAGQLSDKGQDVICMQENAGAGFLTRGVSLRAKIDHSLHRWQSLHWSDLKTTLVPALLRLDHGMSLYTRLASSGAEIVALPQTGTFWFGVVKKFYVGQLLRLPIGDTGKSWVIINLHLSAFDKGGTVRSAQLDHLFAFAQDAYKAGDHVIIAGDWNMRLCPTDFAHRTDLKHLSWLMDFPQNILPVGWRVAVDPTTPTVRSLHAPYGHGHSYTTIVDGFVVSPNVRVAAVTADDEGFADTDHHPVTGQFTALADT